MYDESQWLTELEAFAGANAYTSSELEDLFLDACTIQEEDVWRLILPFLYGISLT